MAFDGITTQNVVMELNQSILGARVEKIYVPNKNDIYINFHTASRENLKLLISIDANNARIHFSKQMKDNPLKAPQICMILRKHLQGAKLLSIMQYGLDRVVIFSFQNLNELGDLVEKKLIVELMGKYSNLILVNAENKIIDAMRHVDSTMSSIREVLPNKPYLFPSTLGKENFLELNEKSFYELLTKVDNPIYTDDTLSSILIGFSKSFCHNLLEESELLGKDITKDSSSKLYQILSSMFQNMHQHSLFFKIVNAHKDYVIDIHSIVKEPLSISYFLDDFYTQKENISIIKNAKLNLKHDIEVHLAKYQKKLDIANQALLEAKDYQKYKEYGELLNCHMHLLKIGMDSISVVNYFNNNQEITIPLQKNLSPSKNAQNYFKKYNKNKNAIEHASTYKAEYENHMEYLSSVLYELNSADSLEEIDEVRQELISQGYISSKYQKAKKKDLPAMPLQYEKDGITILVGKNNLQNDKLTFKIAKKNDMWLHVKKFHGSHVIIESEQISDEVMLYAATLAKEHSEAKNSSKVEVDYCLVKHVHKEVNSKPGMVVYTNYHTIIVD